jgi:hypothetical protein
MSARNEQKKDNNTPTVLSPRFKRLLTSDMISMKDGHVLLYHAFYREFTVVGEIHWRSVEGFLKILLFDSYTWQNHKLTGYMMMCKRYTISWPNR